ncbi:hypothetical protein D3C71_1692280 [compost metagenome]
MDEHAEQPIGQHFGRLLDHHHREAPHRRGFDFRVDLHMQRRLLKQLHLTQLDAVVAEFIERNLCVREHRRRRRFPERCNLSHRRTRDEQRPAG